jgi:predicted chitinase
MRGWVSLTVLACVVCVGTAGAAGKDPLTVEQLRRVMPRLPRERAMLLLEPLNAALVECEINTPKRRAAFLAQVAHESGELLALEDSGDGTAYEGRVDLGNTEPGDGPRFKGRGPLRLTGRANYRKAGDALKLDLAKQPELAARPEHCFRIAGWYWKSNGLNDLADKGDFRQITRRVTGGTAGLESRLKYYRRALEVLDNEL